MDRRLQKNHAKAVRRNALKKERAVLDMSPRVRDSAFSDDSEFMIRLTDKGQLAFGDLFAEPDAATTSDPSFGFRSASFSR